MVTQDDNGVLVSIIVIGFNEERYLAEAIESALAQDYEPIEIIYVDDGSTDQSLAVARRYEDRIRIVSQKNSGGCSSPRNHGVRLSTGQFLSFLDGDDIILPDKISSQMRLISENKNVGLVCGNYQNFSNGVRSKPHFESCDRIRYLLNDGVAVLPKGIAPNILVHENFTITGAALVSREAFLAMGGFNEYLLSCEDYELYYKISCEWSLVVEDRLVMLRRFHDNNLSGNSSKMQRYTFESRMALAAFDNVKSRKLLLRARAYDCLSELIKSSLRKFSLGYMFFTFGAWLRYLGSGLRGK